MLIRCAHTDLVDINSLKPHPKNPNTHPDAQIALLANLISYQGQRAPIVISKRSGFITKGHGRLEAIKSLGWDKCAVDFQDYDSDEQEFTDLVADNKIAELAEFDYTKFREQSLAMDFEADFDLSLFAIPELDLNIDVKLLEVNRGDEESEWVGGLPTFQQPDNEIKLIVIFKTEDEREQFCKDKNIVITNIMNKQWSSRI